MYNVGHSLIGGTIEFDFARQLPHGSGIDATWEYRDTANYVYFSNSFHCMDENGFYGGWQDFSVRLDRTVFSYMVEAKKNYDNYHHEAMKEDQRKRLYVLLDILAESFTLQFNGGDYLANKYFLRDYLENTIHYSIGNEIFNEVK